MLESRKGLVMPVELRVTRADGDTVRRRVPMEAWFTSDTYTLSVVGDVRAVTLDPDRQLPDVARENNAWRAEEASRP